MQCGIGSDCAFPQGLDCFVLQTSTHLDGLNFWLLRDEACSCFTVGHLDCVDGLVGSLNTRFSKVSGCGENVIADTGFSNARSAMDDDVGWRGWTNASVVVCVEFVKFDLLGCVFGSMLLLDSADGVVNVCLWCQVCLLMLLLLSCDRIGCRSG